MPPGDELSPSQGDELRPAQRPSGWTHCVKLYSRRDENNRASEERGGRVEREANPGEVRRDGNEGMKKR
jgi:hypothetical protein